MHKIHAKEFTIDDFSHEHLDDVETCYEYENGDPYTSLDILKLKIRALNYWRNRYNETKDKHAWYQMIQLLDSSYNQKRTVMLNYEVLSNIYHARKKHKLDCWHTFCDWIESLPESWIITEDWRSRENDILKENEELKKKVEELEEKLSMVPEMFKHEFIVPLSDSSNEGLSVKIDDIDETQELIDISELSKL